MTNYIEFATKIKEKYPEYKEVDDLILAQKMVEKYPQYKETITFEEVKPEKKGIDLTPSGLANKIGQSAGVALASPIVAKRDNIPLKQAFEEGMERAENARREDKLAGIQDFITDMAGYSAIPVLRGGGLANFAGNAALQGGVPATLESLKRGGNVAGGAGAGTGIAAALQGLTPVAGKVVNKVLESDAVNKGLPKILEALTSVPAEFSERALQKELAGQSILNGKFNADTAYIPIERKLREAKEMLPTKEGFASEYNKLGKRALEGMEAIKNQAGTKINEVLEGLDINPIDASGLRNSIDTALKGFAKGGDINPASIRASKEVDLIKNMLGEVDEQIKPIDLHNIKETLYDMANYEAAGGIRNDVLKRTANQVNNFLRSKFPQYQTPNDMYSLIMDAERGLDGANTIAGKIKGIGSEGNLLSGLDERLKNIDNLLPAENKFYKQAQNIINSENEINTIKNAIGKQYERNPKLLANRTDEAFEDAINDLQRKTGVNFMDELKDTRAREALEQWFPGQGGGSGSSQGFGNLLRTALIGGSPIAALSTHNPAALLGLVAVSPKITAKGSIKNIGKLSEIASKAQEGAYDKILNTLSQLGAKGASNLLYGGVSYDNYK